MISVINGISRQEYILIVTPLINLMILKKEDISFIDLTTVYGLDRDFSNQTQLKVIDQK